MRDRSTLLATGLLLAGLLATSHTAQAWDTAGHRTITFLALDGLAEIAPDRPAFLTDPTAREMAAFQASEADRYRSVRSGYLKHENDPDHYIDVDDLPAFGLTLDTLPKLRYEYLRAMAIAKHEHPESAPDYNAIGDVAKTTEFPGYGAHAIMEHHAKLIAAFKTFRILDELSKESPAADAGGAGGAEGSGQPPQRAAQIEMAKANILAELGHLSHFVGDLAQPLHVTRHHHGWVGENPQAYTTDKGFHAYIDGTIVTHHALRYTALRPTITFTRRVDTLDPWTDVVAHIQRSFEKVEPLYLLKKTGDLELEPGKAFITERLHDGASMLAAMYADAWTASTPTKRDVESYNRYDGTRAEPGPATTR